MKIIIETIPHKEQRYPTVGDWFYEDGGETLRIKVSQLSDWKRESLIAIHELVEVVLCKNEGISQESVDKFDFEFESDRKEGDLSEPGDAPSAPYNKQHCLATGVERILAGVLGVAWGPYADEVESL